MYIPAVHRIDDIEVIVDIMRSNPFATLISGTSDGPIATHLPVLVEPGRPLVLKAHMARANSHWELLSRHEKSLVIFSGPHGYVSPSWYETTPNVPTWNYVSVHVYGQIEIITEEELALDHLNTMVGTFDPTLVESRPESLDREFHRKMLGGIVVFQIIADRIEAKAKLNQNKAESDRAAVRARYLQSDNPMDRQMGEMMQDEPVA